MTEFNELERRERLSQSDADVKKAIKSFKHYDLMPLYELLKINNPKQVWFSDLYHTKKDFEAADIALRYSGREVLIQDKSRHSGKGCDLGIEFARIYCFIENYADRHMIFDGGRDVHLVKPRPIEVCTEFPCSDWIPEDLQGILLAKRNWDHSVAKNHFYLLHKKDDDAYYWIKSNSVKILIKSLFKQWISSCYNHLDMLKALFMQAIKTGRINELCRPGLDVYCKRDGDLKSVIFKDKDKSCHYCKNIAYIRFEKLFKEGIDWVKTQRRI
jgi:hypothetical protein